jgi:hypothetical protein
MRGVRQDRQKEVPDGNGALVRMLTARANWKYLLLLSMFPDMPSAMANSSNTFMRDSAMSRISRLDILRLATFALP